MPTMLPYQRVLPYNTGLVPAYSAADAAGNRFYNHGGTLLHVQNSSAAAITVTVHYNAWARANAGPGRSTAVSADSVFTVPAGGEIIAGPFPYQDFNEPDDAGTRDPTQLGNYDDTGLVTFSAVAGVTLAALMLDLSIPSTPPT